MNRVFTDSRDNFHGLNKEELRRLLSLFTQESHFQFDNKFYEQIDGFSMGSPLDPLFVNFFMSDFEHKHMNKLKELGVNLWRR